MHLEKRNIRLSKCSVDQAEKEAVARVIDFEYLGMGREVQAFEQELKSYLKTDLEVICVNTGTAALHLAIEALELAQDAEVLVPSITYLASFQAISAARAKPVACDVNPETFFIDLNDAQKRLTKKTKAIMPVHYGSHSEQMDEIYKFAQKHHLRVIEDAAHSMGCSRKNKKVGTSGDTLCFSLDGIKNMTSGEGGFVVTSDSEVARKIRDARLLGVERDTEKRFSNQRSWVFDVKRQGYRYHMSDIMAAIGRTQLQKLDRFLEKRQKLAQMYAEKLSKISWLKVLNFNFSNLAPHIFVIKVVDKNRDFLMEFLNRKGIATGLHYYPNHLLTLYKTEYNLPVSEYLLNQMMTLPLHVDLSEQDVEYVCHWIKEFN